MKIVLMLNYIFDAVKYSKDSDRRRWAGYQYSAKLADGHKGRYLWLPATSPYGFNLLSLRRFVEC